MRFYLLLGALLLAGIAMAGDGQAVTFTAIEVNGYLLLDDTDSIAFSRWLVPDGDDASTSRVTLTQAGRDGVTVIHLSPVTALRIAEEAHPYLLLAQRGRRFEERIAITDTIVVELSYNLALRVAIRSTDQPQAIVYTGDKAVFFLQGMTHAEPVADRWVEDILRGSSPPPDGRLPHPGREPGEARKRPFAPPMRHPGRPPAPTEGHESTVLPDGAWRSHPGRLPPSREPFILHDVEITPLGLGSSLEIKGRLTNRSGKDYKHALFSVGFYDRSENLMGSIRFLLEDFSQGRSLPFSTTTREDILNWSGYSVRLDTAF